MINFKKMDDKDFVFIKKEQNEKEDKEFSIFLKNRKIGKLRSTFNKRKVENVK
jgi:hypothetical protein